MVRRGSMGGSGGVVARGLDRLGLGRLGLGRLGVGRMGLAAIVLSASGGSALGQIFLVSEARALRVSAQATNATGTTVNGPFFASPASVGAAFERNLNATALRTGATGSATVAQTSSIVPDRIQLLGNLSSSTSALSGNSVLVELSNTFDIRFFLAAGTTWQISGSRAGAASWRLEGPGGTTILENLGTVTGTELVGGQYRLVGGATGQAARPGGPTNFGGSYSVTFTAVPTPGVLALAGGLGLLAARRRR